MSWRVLLCLPVVAALSCAPARAQTEVANPSARIVKMIRDIVVAPDGSWVITVHNETRLLDPAAVTALAQGMLPYSALLQQVEVTEAHTLKSDGRQLAVAPDAILDQQAPAVRGRPVLSDIKQKVILYPNVEVGDTLVYSAIVTSKPMIPGNFFFATVLPSIMPVDDAAITVSLPKSMPAITAARGLDVGKAEAGDRVVYTVRYARERGTNPGTQAVSEFDRAAEFSLSTFRNYDDFARSYGGLALPTIAVTPAIHHQADLITEGVGDRREQARKIYQWVASHIRYVALEFGQGSIVPHSADSVLTNAYGDCKDKAVLFAALLRARGIDSNLAIINSADAYTIAEPPNAAPFNHVINWLPEFRMYADTTNGVSVPFGLLPRSEYGKETIHVGDAHGARHKVPAPDAKASTESYKLTLKMDDAGHVEAESSNTATGDFAAPLRQIGALMQGENGKKLAMTVLAREGMPGATGAFMAPAPDLDQPQYSIAATYAPAEPIAALATGSDFRLIDNLQFAKPVSATFFGLVLDDRYRNADPVTCFSGRSTDDETMQFPSSRHLVKLPEDNSVKTSHIAYASHWSQTATSVSVHREFTAEFDAPLCSGALRQEVLSAYAKIRADTQGSAIALPRN